MMLPVLAEPAAGIVPAEAACAGTAADDRIRIIPKIAANLIFIIYSPYCPLWTFILIIYKEYNTFVTILETFCN
jgi:hypothetical protein